MGSGKGVESIRGNTSPILASGNASLALGRADRREGHPLDGRETGTGPWNPEAMAPDRDAVQAPLVGGRYVESDRTVIGVGGLSEEHPKPGLGWRHEIWRGPAVLCLVGAAGAVSLMLQDWAHRRYFGSTLWVVLAAISVWAGVRALQGKDWPPETRRARLITALAGLAVGLLFLVESIAAAQRRSMMLAGFGAVFAAFFLLAGASGLIQSIRGRERP